MGNRDIKKEKKKKSSKDLKKPITSSGIITPQEPVEVIKKGKKKTGEDIEE